MHLDSSQASPSGATRGAISSFQTSLMTCYVGEIVSCCSTRRLIPLSESVADIAAGEILLEALELLHPNACLVIGRSPLTVSISSVRSLTFDEARRLLCDRPARILQANSTIGDLTDVIC